MTSVTVSSVLFSLSWKNLDSLACRLDVSHFQSMLTCPSGLFGALLGLSCVFNQLPHVRGGHFTEYHCIMLEALIALRMMTCPKRLVIFGARHSFKPTHSMPHEGRVSLGQLLMPEYSMPLANIMLRK